MYFFKSTYCPPLAAILQRFAFFFFIKAEYPNAGSKFRLCDETCAPGWWKLCPASLARSNQISQTVFTIPVYHESSFCSGRIVCIGGSAALTQCWNVSSHFSISLKAPIAAAPILAQVGRPMVWASVEYSKQIEDQSERWCNEDNV